MEIKVKKLVQQKINEGASGTVNTYVVMEGNREFLIDCTSHPHHGTSLSVSGKEGTLHINPEEDKVIRQIVALGGGCALAIHEEVVEGLSPASLRTVIAAERTREMGQIAISSDVSEHGT
jgi:hypothetical protein